MLTNASEPARTPSWSISASGVSASNPNDAKLLEMKLYNLEKNVLLMSEADQPRMQLVIREVQLMLAEMKGDVQEQLANMTRRLA